MLSRHLNLAIVDDHSLFRIILRNYLSEQKYISVPFVASDMPELLKMLEENSIDLLLMRIALPKSSDKDLLRVIRTKYPTLKILIISMGKDVGSITYLPDAGIDGYISDMDNPEDLLSAIQMVSENQLYHAHTFTGILDWHGRHDIKVLKEKPSVFLSAREKWVLRLIWEEKTTKEIAGALSLSVKSIEKVRQDMKEKTGIRSTIGLLKYAISRKIINSVSDAAVYRIDCDI